jgi:uncharacterized membrane protein YdbT with pleckstrin-like domain
VVVTGQLRAIDINHDPPQLLNYLNPGALFGTRTIFENTPRTATIEVVIDATLAIYHRDDWEWIIHKNDRFETYFRTLERQFDETSRMAFPGLQGDEVVVIAVKRHILALLARLTLPLILLIIPVLFLIAEELIGFTFLEIITENLTLTLVFTAPFLFLAIVISIYQYLDWRNDDFIVTTKRVIHIERVLLYGEQRDEAPLVRIQDVTVIMHDILSKFADYHDLEIATAGAGIISIDGIPHAEEIQNIIFQEQERARARLSAADIAAIRHMIARRLAWESALEEPVMAVAEDEAAILAQSETRRLPAGLEYFWPRVKIINNENGVAVITWRKHLFMLIRNIFFPLLAVLVSLYLFITSFFANILFDVEFGPWIFGFLLFISLIWYLWQYDGWRKDQYKVTDRRIVDIEGTPFNLRGEQQREGTFDNIQNITYDIPNFFTKIINMGDVVIETAGSERTFTFDHVFNPSGVQEEIFNRMVLFQQRQREQVRDATTDRLVEVVAEYHRLLEKTNPQLNSKE